MKLRPLHDKVVVERQEEEKTSAGGIILSGNATDSGDVAQMGVSVGDTVIFGQYGGSEVKIDGQEYLILGESDIFGVIES